MMASLPIDFHEFTFIDVGSGKGRTLLMASEYPFRRIVGIEILPELHRAAQENIAAHNNAKFSGQIEAICADAREFAIPEQPLILYLFNPLPPAGLKQFLANLGEVVEPKPRPSIVLYHNPLLEQQLQSCSWLKLLARVNGSVVYTNSDGPGNPRRDGCPSPHDGSHHGSYNGDCI